MKILMGITILERYKYFQNELYLSLFLQKNTKSSMHRESKQQINLKDNGNRKILSHRIRKKQLK